MLHDEFPQWSWSVLHSMRWSLTFYMNTVSVWLLAQYESSCLLSPSQLIHVNENCSWQISPDIKGSWRQNRSVLTSEAQTSHVQWMTHWHKKKKPYKTQRKCRKRCFYTSVHGMKQMFDVHLWETFQIWYKTSGAVIWHGQCQKGSQTEYATVSKRCVSHESPAVNTATAHPH